MKTVGIITPAYDAAATVVQTLERIPDGALSDLGYTARVYVVDDGSRDGTGDVVRAAAGALSVPTRVLVHPTNRGYGAAQKTGLTASLDDGNDLHVLVHADGQYAPEELPAILAPLNAGAADVVIGSKFARGGVLRQGMPLSRMIGIRLLDRLENAVHGLKGLEFHSGYMAYSTAVLRRVPVGSLTDGFHFDGEMVVSSSRAGFRATLVPISTCYSGTVSSLRAAPYLREVFRSILRHVRNR